MAAADIGANASNYTGNANLGGGDFGSVVISTKPFEDLARYTDIYNKAEYDQRQKDNAAAIQELAKITAYDLSQAHPKDRKIVEDAYAEFQTFLRNNPTALSYTKNREGNLQYLEKKRKLTELLESAKGRFLTYKSRDEALKKELNKDVAAIKRKKLDDAINSTDVYTQIPPDEEYELATVKIPAAKRVSFDVLDRQRNEIIKRDYDIPDRRDMLQKVAAIEFGLIQEYEKGSSQENELKIASGRFEPIKSAENFSAALQPFVENGVVNMEKAYSSGNSMVINILKQIENYNLATKDAKEKIAAGIFVDKLGKPVSFGYNGVMEEDYRTINLVDGKLSTRELWL